VLIQLAYARATAETQLEAALPASAARPTPIRNVDTMLVRPARIADMRRVEPLINSFARQNLMLPKSLDQLVRTFREFAVATDADDRLLGCGALRVYGETLGEIVSLAVDEAAHGAGIGRALVERLLEEARALGLHTVFALTLRAGFFHRLGFRTVPKEMFPLKIWADCRSCPKLHACDEVAVAMDVHGAERHRTSIRNTL
jgi:amino-acid N-acetyltransferase